MSRSTQSSALAGELWNELIISVGISCNIVLYPPPVYAHGKYLPKKKSYKHTFDVVFAKK